MIVIKTPPEIRFFKKVIKNDDGCWEWVGCKDPNGYGQFWDGYAQASTHRWSYEFHKGKIPDGLVVDHLCRNASCVNPEHMEAVTMKVNTERGYLYHVFAAKSAIKTHCKRNHLLSGKNLLIDKRGDRSCKECQAMKGREWKAANRERVNELQRIRRVNAK